MGTKCVFNQNSCILDVSFPDFQQLRKSYIPIIERRYLKSVLFFIVVVLCFVFRNFFANYTQSSAHLLKLSTVCGFVRSTTPIQTCKMYLHCCYCHIRYCFSNKPITSLSGWLLCLLSVIDRSFINQFIRIQLSAIYNFNALIRLSV